MPAYLIIHPHEQRRDDVLVEDPRLTLGFTNGWAILRDASGICYAIPADAGAHIQRVDEPQDHEPAPQKE